MTISAAIKNNLISVITQLSQNTMITQQFSHWQN